MADQPPDQPKKTPSARDPDPGKPDPLLGQRLGDYVVRRYIGSGGMGVVYEGEHLTIGRKVAIKLIREDLTTNPHARRLLTEARAASAIRHRGIIDIFGFGQEPSIGQYLVMEYLDGRPLNELLQSGKPLPLPEALDLLCQVLDALSAAHAVGVIHRDLKPSNIFIVRESNGTEYVKVLDFGLAKRSATPEGTTPQTSSDIMVGTPPYMAPEQALGEEVGPQTDLYAVGVIAFELLTGRRPFTGRSHMEIVAHHLKTPPPAPSTLVRLPPEVDALVLRLLAKEPRQRPASASEVSRELKALLQRREGTSLPPMQRISRSVPAVNPPAPPASANAPTATMASPTPGARAESPLPPPTNQGRRAAVGAAPKPPGTTSSFHAYREIEVSGATVIATLEAFGQFKSLASQLMQAEGLARKDPDGQLSVDLESWYPLDAFLRAFARADQRLGEALVHQIGVKVMTRLTWPPAMKDLPTLARFLDMGYHAHHRRNGQIMGDPSTGLILEGIGHFHSRIRSDGVTEFEVDAPYPCAFDKGILFGALRRMGIVGAIIHDQTHPCRKRGSPSCIYVIKT